MFPASVANTIGMQNIASCERLLATLGIPIVARHCGGEQGRRMSLDTTDGKVMAMVAYGDDAPVKKRSRFFL